jgi:hypothetical protein
MIQGETLPEMNPELIVRAEESRDPNRSHRTKDNAGAISGKTDFWNR